MTLITNHTKSESDKVFSEDQIVQILALDGGGLKGLFSAAVIESLEEQLGHSISEHFDIITGTSTGGLIALGLGLEKSGSDIVEFYQKEGPKIFPNSMYRRTLGWFFSKYSNRYLKKVFQKLFVISDSEERPTLLNSKKRLIIPTFYASQSEPRLLKTPHDRRYRSDWKLPIWAVAMATSAAPTYFPSFEYNNNRYLDGGLWANNPSLIGVVEALEMGASIENIRVLNISTTSSRANCLSFKIPLLSKISLRRAGKILWASTLLSTIMQSNSYSTVHMHLRQMLAPGNLAVIDDHINFGHAGLDDIDYEEFYSRGKNAAEQAKNNINHYFDHIAPMYFPNEEAIGDKEV